MQETIVIASVPYVDVNRPMAAPAVLKAALAQHGINSTTLDLNAEVVTKVSGHFHKDKILKFFYKQKVDDLIVEDVGRIIEYCADRILAYNPSIIALSLFCFDCQVFTAWLCAAIRHRNASARIVVGGPGLKTNVTDITYRDRLLELGLIDDYIIGDGEQAFVEYVKGNLTYPGINSENWIPVTDLNSLPAPDYSDYNWFWYKEPTIPIMDSKGCVRDCEFCDVVAFWKKYQSMTADKIFEQMMHQYEKHDILHFDFRSSISNGNLKEFKKLLSLMTEYNRGKYRSEQISWEGSFIVRPASQHPELIWQQLQATNARIFMGVESVIQHVRNDLGKSFNNDDIDYHLAMGQKYGITQTLLLIVAYPTETLEDYEFTKQWFRDRWQYANNSVIEVFLSPLDVLPGTKLEQGGKNMMLTPIHTKKDRVEWVNQNLNISYEQRQQYYQELKQICSVECGFTVV